LIGGWQLNLIPTIQSGVNRNVTSPNTTTVAYVTQHANATGISPYSSFNLNGATITPREGFGSNNRSLYWFDPFAFTQAAPLTFGTAGRDIISSPGFMNWDMSLFKTFVVRENMNLTFRAEFFDAFNQTRFDPPVLDSSNPFFGQIQAAEQPRIIQLGLRLQF